MNFPYILLIFTHKPVYEKCCRKKNLFKCIKCPFNEECSSIEIAYKDKNEGNSEEIENLVAYEQKM